MHEVLYTDVSTVQKRMQNEICQYLGLVFKAHSVTIEKYLVSGCI